MHRDALINIVITIVSFENRTISFGNLAKKKKNRENACSILMNEAFGKNHFRKHLNISCCVPSCLISTKEQKLIGVKEDGKLKSNR